MTALEALRLDLMRLHAGKASLDELTQDVAEARRIGEEIDAEMKGGLMGTLNRDGGFSCST